MYAWQRSAGHTNRTFIVDAIYQFNLCCRWMELADWLPNKNDTHLHERKIKMKTSSDIRHQTCHVDMNMHLFSQSEHADAPIRVLIFAASNSENPYAGQRAMDGLANDKDTNQSSRIKSRKKKSNFPKDFRQHNALRFIARREQRSSVRCDSSEHIESRPRSNLPFRPVCHCVATAVAVADTHTHTHSQC